MGESNLPPLPVFFVRKRFLNSGWEHRDSSFSSLLCVAGVGPTRKDPSEGAPGEDCSGASAANVEPRLPSAYVLPGTEEVLDKLHLYIPSLASYKWVYESIPALFLGFLSQKTQTLKMYFIPRSFMTHIGE